MNVTNDTAWNTVVDLSQDQESPVSYQKLGAATRNYLLSYSDQDLGEALMLGNQTIRKMDNIPMIILSTLALFGMETLVHGLRTGAIKVVGDSKDVQDQSP